MSVLFVVLLMSIATPQAKADELAVPPPVDDVTQTQVTPESTCEIEGHKYDAVGNPLSDWEIGLMKIRMYDDENIELSGLTEGLTDENGYYCLDWDGESGLEGVEEPYDFMYHVYEILKEGWSLLRIEKGTVEQNEALELQVVSEEDILTAEDIVSTQVFEANNYLPANTAYHVDFWNYQTDSNTEEDTYRIEGYVWNDKNENDVWEKEGENIEDDLFGWTVTATNGETTLTTTTDENGLYFFDVPAGVWTISETLQNEWNQTFPNAGTYVVTAPALSTMNKSESIFARALSTIIPTAYSATIDTFGPFNFGNVFKGCVTNCGGSSNGGGGGGGSSRSGSKSSHNNPDPDPVGEVLGESTSVLPSGAPDTGFGGTAGTGVATFLSLLGMLMSIVTVRATRNV
jgi:hypothetical protein